MTQMNAVYWVLVNRTRDAQGRWPRNLIDVITQKAQFSSFNVDSVDAVFPSPSHSMDWEAWQRCVTVINTPLGSDPTCGANCYHTEPDDKPQPAWADIHKLTLVLGPFKFFKL